jgi:hypothetical protein
LIVVGFSQYPEQLPFRYLRAVSVLIRPYRRPRHSLQIQIVVDTHRKTLVDTHRKTLVDTHRKTLVDTHRKTLGVIARQAWVSMT